MVGGVGLTAFAQLIHCANSIHHLFRCYCRLCIDCSFKPHRTMSRHINRHHATVCKYQRRACAQRPCLIATPTYVASHGRYFFGFKDEKAQEMNIDASSSLGSYYGSAVGDLEIGNNLGYAPPPPPLHPSLSHADTRCTLAPLALRCCMVGMCTREILLLPPYY